MSRQVRVLLGLLIAATLGCSVDIPPPDCDENRAHATRCFDIHSPYGLLYNICEPSWAGGFAWEDVRCLAGGGEPCLRGSPGSETVIPNTVCWYGYCYCSDT